MIKFECPNCQRKLSVKDELAGKKGKCPGCKKGVVIPATSTPLPTPSPVPQTVPTPTPQPPQLPTPPRLDGPVRTQAEIDMEAAEALADEPPPEDAPPDEITFDCPMCGEKVTLKAELAGKRAPCPNPDCRRIIPVPKIERKTPANWREVDRRPAGARPVNQPTPEGGIESQNKTTISAETAEEFGLGRKKEKPVPFLEKVIPPLYYGTMLLVASLLVLGLVARQYAGFEKGLLAGAEDYVKDSKTTAAIGREGQASLYRGLADYQLRRKVADSAAQGKKQCDAALGTLSQSREGTDRDLVLLDIGQTLIDFSADKKDPQVERGEKIDWDETQKSLTTIIRSMKPEARQEGLRILGRRLIAANHGERALALAGLAISRPAERADAQALIGLEMHAAGKKDLTERAAERALQPYLTKDVAPPPLTPAVVTLALLTQKKIPQANPDSLEAEDETVGQIEAKAREGKIEEARTSASSDKISTPLKYRCFLALAGVTADTDAADVETAANLLASMRKKDVNIPAWSVYRLVDLGLRAKMPPERLREIASQTSDSVLRSRANLLVLVRELSGTKDVKPVAGPDLDKLDATSLGRLLATEIVCRHNTSVNSSWGNEVQEWKDAQKAFGAIGVLQGRHPR
jgi:hypothetical protein